MLRARFRVAVAAAFLVVFLGASPLWAANFLWRVETPGGGRAYILGSIHLARAELYPLPEAIMEPFRQSRQLAVELDVEALDDNELQAYVRQHGLTGDRRPLTERLSPQTLAVLKGSPFKTEQYNGLKPWLAALSLQVDVMTQLGYDGEYGLDRFFLKQARARALPIVELESLAEQMGPLAGMSDEESDLFFRVTVLELNDLAGLMGVMFVSWQNGDTAEFARVFFQEYDKYPELMPILDKIIFRRNESMAARLEQLLSQNGGPYFIVVGAGHLVGPGSILEILAESGHSLEQM